MEKEVEAFQSVGFFILNTFIMKIDSIIDNIGKIPFSVFYDKFLKCNNGNYNKLNAQGIWLSMSEEQREEAFTVIAQMPRLHGMHPEYYLKIFKR